MLVPLHGAIFLVDPQCYTTGAFEIQSANAVVKKWVSVKNIKYIAEKNKL